MISQMIVKSNIFDKINDYMSIDMIKLDTAWNTSIVACVRTNTMPCSRVRAERGPAGQLRPEPPGTAVACLMQVPDGMRPSLIRRLLSVRRTISSSAPFLRLLLY